MENYGHRFEFCAATAVCDDGELAGSGSGDSGSGIAADSVHAGEGGLGIEEPGAVPSLGVHRNILCGSLSGSLGIIEVYMLVHDVCMGWVVRQRIRIVFEGLVTIINGCESGRKEKMDKDGKVFFFLIYSKKRNQR